MKALLRRGPWLTLLLALLAVGLGSRGAFELDRAAVLGGQWWRVVTGQFVHYGPAHALGDILGFSGWAAIIEARSRRLLLGGVLLSLAAIGPGILLFCPAVTHYRGLSGVDLALATMVLCVLGTSSRIRRLRGAPALVGIAVVAYIAKLGYELVVGQAILAPDLGHDVRLLPAAHVLGAVAGLSAYALWHIRASRSGNRSAQHSRQRNLYANPALARPE
jgi:rhomboid family GlyGly-CTERM serine protease